jgi:hypothetical protein
VIPAAPGFAQALHSALEHVQQAFPDVRVVAYTDNMHLQGSPRFCHRLLVDASARLAAPPPPSLYIYRERRKKRPASRKQS